MKCLDVDVVFQEVPGEISLAFHCTGCPVRCPACHSKNLWDANCGEEFNDELLMDWLGRYGSDISCVLFYGGEWEPEWLCAKLDLIKGLGFKTALYTGQETVTDDIAKRLNYLKTGPFIEELGGLRSRTTNQKMVNLDTKEDITSRFWRT